MAVAEELRPAEVSYLFADVDVEDPPEEAD